MPHITFMTTDIQKEVAASIGIPTGSGTEFESCSLQVGDLISWPEAPSVAYRVTRRWYRAGNLTKPSMWYLTIEPAGDPCPPES